MVLPRKYIQTDNLDDQTRVEFWNLVGPFLEENDRWHGIAGKEVWTKCFRKPFDEYPSGFSQEVKYRLQEYPFAEVMDLLEFLGNSKRVVKWEKWREEKMPYRRTEDKATIPRASDYNRVFEQFLVGFRFVGDVILPITDEKEIQAVKEALIQSPDAVTEQLDKSMKFLASRENPQYAQSLQCSISAVESQCRILLNNNKLELGAALAELEKQGLKIHKALKKGFQTIYGFTSDENGVRHGGIEPSEVDANLAQFFLVACSAFVNYLRGAGWKSKDAG